MFRFLGAVLVGLTHFVCCEILHYIANVEEFGELAAIYPTGKDSIRSRAIDNGGTLYVFG